MNKKSHLFFIASGLLFIGTNCAHGGMINLRFQNLQYPASMSSYLYDMNWNRMQPGKNLEYVNKVTVSKKIWGLGWGAVSLSSANYIDDQLNREIKKVNGVGIVNVSVSTRGCGLNGLLPFLTILPIVPGCGRVTVQGIIVRLK